MVDRGQRKKSDMYETPYSLTKLFLNNYWPNPILKTLEPMCGNGAIVKVLREYGYKDLEAYDISQGKDFLKETNKVPQIITNPAFSIAFETIQKCKEICTDRFALLLPLSYLHGKQRYDHIWKDYDFPLERVFVFTRYPMMGDPLREDGMIRTGMLCLAWFCWNKHYEGEPTISWLDIDNYVLKKGREHDNE